MNSWEYSLIQSVFLFHSLRNLPCKNRLKHLNLHSFERLRALGILIKVYRWMKGFDKDDVQKALVIGEQVRMRNNGFELTKFRFRKGRQILVY